MEEKKSDEEKMDEIKRKVFKHPDADELHFKRVPKKTIDIFKKFANEEFVGDYGLCFKIIFEEALEYRRLKDILLEKGELTIIREKKNDN